MNVAEDVYYVTRDGNDVFGLNQLMYVPPQLSRIEVEAIQAMCGRARGNMLRMNGAAPLFPLSATSLAQLAHGLYYVGPDGRAWLLSQKDCRPDLDGTEMDFAQGTVEAGASNLYKLQLGIESC